MKGQKLSSLLKVVSAACLLLVAIGCSATGTNVRGELVGQSNLAVKKHTNILLIMADDLSAFELGSYGNTENETPRLDALAAGGVQFETFYATPVCSPTRVALMTGRRAPKTGWYNMRGRDVGGVGRGADLATDEVTFGEIFEKAGYATAFAGKWQLTGNHLSTMLSDVGFQDSLMWIYTGYLESGQEYLGGFEGKGNNKASRFWHPGLARNGEHFATKPEDYGPDMLADFLVEYISKKKDEPFFIYYPMLLIHRPWVDTPDVRDLRENSLAARKANVEYMDKIIGRLMDALDENGLTENTLVIFLGDNGTQTFGKGTPTEFGNRVPGIFSMPGTIPGGRVSKALTELVDIYPTIADYAGIELDEALDLDGKSLRPVLEGSTDFHREYVYAPLGHYRSIRMDNWVLEANSRERYGKLFYTGERRDGLGYLDVTDANTPEVREAKRRLNAYMREVPFPRYQPEDRLSFEELTDKRINDLYEWIEKEEARLGVAKLTLEGVEHPEGFKTRLEPVSEDIADSRPMNRQGGERVMANRQMSEGEPPTRTPRDPERAARMAERQERMAQRQGESFPEDDDE